MQRARDRKEDRQLQQPYGRSAGSPRGFHQDGSHVQDYETVFQEYEKELALQGGGQGPPQESQDFRKLHRDALPPQESQDFRKLHRGAQSDRSPLGKGRPKAAPFSRGGSHIVEPGYGRNCFERHQQSGQDWQMDMDYSQQPGLLGAPPASSYGGRGKSELNGTTAAEL